MIRVLVLSLGIVTGASAQDMEGGGINATPLDRAVGRALFERLWVQSPSSTHASDGLGPLYVARSCAACHPNGGGGQNELSRTLRLAMPDAPYAPIYGAQLQPRGIVGHPGEGRLALRHDTRSVRVGDDWVTLERPLPSLVAPAYGAPDPDMAMSLRIAPPLHGLGALEHIPEQMILAQEDPEDRDGDGISGRASRLRDDSARGWQLGRFGYKATEPNLNTQSATAFARDIGIGTPHHPDGWGDCTAEQTACRAAPDGNTAAQDGLELSQQGLDLVVAYLHGLEAAPKEDPAGEALFASLGCASCHTPEYVTEHGTIRPYTDLLLHDMGPGLADDLREGDAEATEWRTAPLWAMSEQTYFLHDGRATSVLDAILWHGGEADAARSAVLALSPADRDALIAYLEHL